MQRAALLLALSHVISAYSRQITHKAPALLPGWSPVMRLAYAEPATQTTSFMISFTPISHHTISELAANVSDPQNPLYGQYLRRTELTAIAAPDAAHVAIVHSWLNSNAVNFTTPWANSNLLHVETSVAKAEALFSTHYQQLSSAETGQSILRAGDVSVPEEIDRVATIFGLHGLPLPPRQTQSDSPVGNTQGESITPQLLRSLYQVTSGRHSPNSTSKATVNLQGSMLGGVEASDLQAFMTQFVPDASPEEASWTRSRGDENLDGTKTSVEASMDIQYIKGVAPEVATEIWNYNSADFCTDLKRWLSDALSAQSPPDLFSLSYGWQGELDRVGCTESHVLDIENSFQQMALRGITVIVSSGDFGAAYGGERGAGDAHTFYPAWPASSPWVTSVGATEFSTDGSEQAVSSFGSGGGFSQYPGSSDRTRALWQERAVSSYLNSSVTMPQSSDSWSPVGRATPDVSALGSPQYELVVGGVHQQNGGTSAAAPTFSAIVSLLNSARLGAGKPPMGLITPFLYQNADAFTDVIAGDNRVCGWWASKTQGFEAAKGWDPVTGLGTPVFPRLLAAALGESMPPTHSPTSTRPSAAPTREPTHANTPPATGCDWQTANVKCASDADCSGWAVSQCARQLSEQYCRENGFCHFRDK